MESHVRLIISSKHLSPEQIISALGVRGDKVWSAGDRRGNSEILENDSGLIISSRAEKTSDIDVHIESIMALVNGLERNFKTFSEIHNCEIQLSCAAYCDNAPPLTFERPVISWIYEIGASLDIDIYLI